MTFYKDYVKYNDMRHDTNSEIELEIIR